MWRTTQLTPSVREKVIYIAENERDLAYTFAFPLVNESISLKLLQLSFRNAVGIYYIDGFYATKEKPKKVSLKSGRFQKPEGGWFFKDRRYYVIKSTKKKKSDVFAVEMLKRYQALTCGVTIYFDPRKSPDVDKVVAAIDFGTSYSGYAYSFESNPEEIFTNEWRAQGLTLATAKAPTTVLLHPDGTFHSFGYDAEDEYAMLVDGEVFKDWYYFRNFKMKLYSNKDLRRQTLLDDVDGKQIQALKIFTFAIGHMKKMLLDDVRIKQPLLRDKDVTWVITVPAIWSDAAKQFMREATVNAGIDGDNLTLVLEPEAASLYCKTREPADMRVISGTKVDNPMGPGKKYILLDLGGGTADMSAHEVLENGRDLREIHRATGDALGGVVIDEQFNKVITEIIGGEPMLDFFQDYRADYVVFMREFEDKKRMPLDRTSNIVVTLPNSLLEMLIDRFKTTIEEVVQQCPHASHVKVRGDKLMLDTTMIEMIYKKTVDGIVAYIKEMKLDERLHDVKTIILAGGLSKSTYVIRAITNAFPEDLILSPSDTDQRTEPTNEKSPENLIIAPTDPGIAILKGAVLMGHEPERITERIARYTYGVSYARKPFYEGEDPDELKAERNGEVYCDGLFEKLVEIGQTVKWGQVFTVQRTSQLNRLNSKFQPLYTKLYASIETDPEYCTEEYYCVKIGEIVRLPPEVKGWPDVMKSTIEIKFGETEMTVVIREKTTGVVYKARLDSL